MGEKKIWSIEEMELMPRARGESIFLNLRFYYTGKPCINNHLCPRHAESGKCIECKRKIARITIAKRRKRAKTNNNVLKDDLNLVTNNLYFGKTTHGLSNSLEMLLWKAAKNRAKKKNIEFSIKVTDIHIPERCPVLGIVLDKRWGNVIQNNSERFNKPSLDRINPTIGYTPSNIMVMSYRANIIKGDGFPDEHRKIAEFLKEHGL
jgi:hypothetical protein